MAEVTPQNAGTHDALQQRLDAELAQRSEKGLLRTIKARDAAGEGPHGRQPRTDNCQPHAEDWRDLASNDYLRLSRHPAVIAAAVEATQKWGASSSASPLISGYTTAHAELEQRLCAWGSFPHALVWNTGYAANQAVLSTLPQSGDIVLADRLIHNSMITGLVRSGARLQRYRHCDLDHLETLLRQFASGERCVFVVTESVFSMDGDAPDMQRLAHLKNRYRFFLIVDEAHALGWYGARGSGLLEQSGTGEAADIVVGTLGKGLGSMGAYTLLRSEALRSYLINFAGEFIYSTYLPPACACAATAAINIVDALGAKERGRLHALSRSVRAALPGAPQGDSPIVPLPLGDAGKTMHAATLLRSAGFSVGAVRPPTVPEGSSRLRFSLHTQLSTAHIETLAHSVQEVLQ